MTQLKTVHFSAVKLVATLIRNPTGQRGRTETVTKAFASWLHHRCSERGMSFHRAIFRLALSVSATHCQKRRRCCRRHFSSSSSSSSSLFASDCCCGCCCFIASCQLMLFTRVVMLVSYKTRLARDVFVSVLLSSRDVY